MLQLGKFKKTITLIFFLNSIVLLSQDIKIPELKKIAVPELIHPSPTVSSLIKFQEMPVNFYTGIPDISESLMRLDIDETLNINLTLGYHPSGIRLEEYASWVGTGWSLRGTGGFISRTVKGGVDDLGGIFTNGYYNSSYTENIDKFDQINYDQLYAGESAPSRFSYDTMSDIFHFDFMGHSGKFIFTKSGDTLAPVMLKGDSNIKIKSVTTGLIKEIHSFELTDGNGYVYSFNEKEVSDVASTSTGILRNGNGLAISGENYLYTSSWHLSDIKDKNGRTLCSFEYTTVVEKTKSNSYTKYHHYYTPLVVDLGPPENLSQMLPYSTESNNLTTIASKKVSKISVPRKGKLIFTNTLNRLDYVDNSGCYLNNVMLLDWNDVLIKKINFNYSYLSLANRLFLNGFDHVSVDGVSSLSYQFKYNQPQHLPLRDSFSRDLWGYYNGRRNLEAFPALNIVGIDGADMSTHAEFIKTGVLEGIVYPNGGYKNFEFESNTYSKVADHESDFFDHPQNFIRNQENLIFNMNNGAPFSSNYKIIYLDYGKFLNFNLSVLNYNHALPPMGPADLLAYKVKISPLLPLYNFNPDTDPINQNKNMYQFDGASTEALVARPTYDMPLDYNANGIATLSCNGTFFIKGFYLVEIASNGDLPEMQDIVDYKLTFDWYRYQPNMKYNFGGGLRIKSVKYFDSYNNFWTELPRREFSYLYYNFENPSRSSGSIINLPVHYYYKRGVWSGYTHFMDSELTLEPRSDLYIVSESHSATATNSTNGSFVGYKNVKVSDISEGSIKYFYTAPEDFPEPIHYFNYPFTSQVPDNDYKRGLLEKEEHFDKDDVLKMRIRNTYDFRESEIFGGINVSQAQFGGCHVNNSIYGGWVKNYTTYNLYRNLSRRLNNNVEKISFFSWCDNIYTFISLNVLNYKKGWARLTEVTKETFFDSGIINNRFRYFYHDHNKKLASEQMATLHNNGTNQYEILSKLYTYTSDIIDPQHTEVKNQLLKKNFIETPIETKLSRNGVLIESQQSVYKDWGNNFHELEFIAASKSDNPLEPQVRFNRYDEYRHPLEVQQENGMKISYIYGYNQTEPVAKIENMAYASIPPNLITAIHDANESNMATALNALRIAPALAHAMLTTYTYKPLVGVTSITDPKGDKITYEYDSFGRLKAVRDKDNNLLSENEYKYRTLN